MVLEMTNHPPATPGAPLQAKWEGLTKDVRLWESNVATGEYYCRPLSPVLSRLIYKASIESLVDQCYRNKVLVRAKVSLSFFLLEINSAFSV